MDRRQSAVIASVRMGATIDEAAAQAGVNVHTLRRWLSTGRKDPSGRYGMFASLVDRLKGESTGPLELARAFILAFGAFMHSGSEEDGLRMQAMGRRIPKGDEDLVMLDLADHLLIAVVRQMREGTTADDFPAAFEELFQEVDEIHEIRERRASSR